MTHSDNEGLRWMLNMADETVKLVILCVRLQELWFDVVNQAGIKNQVNDVLSMLETTWEDQTELNYEVLVLLIE